MYKRILSTILISAICIGTLIGCGKVNDNKKEIINNTENINDNNMSEEVSDYTYEDKEISSISKDNITNEDLLYYHVISIKLEEFYRTYSLLGNSIDDLDEDDYIYYLTSIDNEIEEIKKISEPANLIDAKVCLISSLEQYKEAAICLKDSYFTSNNDSFTDYTLKASNAVYLMQDFLAYCENFDDYVQYLSSIMENNFYLEKFTLYTRNSEFSDIENEVLFKINHSLIRIPDMINNIFVYLYEDKDYTTELVKAEELIENMNKLEIENDNIKNFRDNAYTYSLKFIEYIKEYIDCYENGNIIDITSKYDEIHENGENIYRSIDFMANFYNEKGIALSYTSLDDRVQMETEYEIDVSGDEIEVINEETNVVE